MSTKDYFRHHNQEMAKRVKYSCKRCEFRTKDLLAYKVQSCGVFRRNSDQTLQ